jgi:hypothetical protein
MSAPVANAPEVEVTVKVQVAWLVTAGINLMDIVQLWVGTREGEQVFPEITNPLPRALGTVSAPVLAPPALVMVNFSSALWVFTAIVPNTSGFGVMVRIAGLVAVAVMGRLNRLPPSEDAVSSPE